MMQEYHLLMKHFFFSSLSSLSFPVLNWPSRPLERAGMLKLRHSLGCFSTLVPWAERAPLQPLTIQQPGPASWYSGLCPCLPGTVSFLFLSAASFPHAPSARGSLKVMHEMLQMIEKLQVARTESYEPVILPIQSKLLLRI